MTLRPGSAFANDSAFQCLAKIRRDVTLVPGPTTDPVGNVAYTQLYYWEISDDNRLKLPDDSYVTTESLVFPYAFPFYVVEMPDGSLIATTSEAPLGEASGVAFTTPHTFSTANEMVFTNTQTPPAECVRAPRLQGYFALVGASDGEGDITEDAEFNELGFFPQQSVVVNGGDAGTNQGITGTCMTSLQDAGKYNTLTSG
jgi:hypothetical protein